MCEDGTPVSGYILITYIITPLGTVKDANVIAATDWRLSSSVLAATADWRFKPARLDGNTVSTPAMQEFRY